MRIKIKQPNRPSQTIQLGEFAVVSGQLTISDPCYDTDVWCKGDQPFARNGQWRSSILEVEIDDRGSRVAMLVAHHEACAVSIDDLRWQLTPIRVGVDSGQAGIFDSRFYKDASVAEGQLQAEYIRNNPWYAMCCYQTNTATSAGIVPYGVVASSGLGDGSYSCYALREGDEVVAMCIDFGLFDEEEEEEEEEEGK